MYGLVACAAGVCGVPAAMFEASLVSDENLIRAESERGDPVDRPAAALWAVWT